MSSLIPIVFLVLIATLHFCLYSPTELASLPRLTCNSAILVKLALKYLVVFGLDGPPEEGPAGGADLTAVVRMFARLLSTAVAEILQHLLLGRDDLEVLENVLVLLLVLLLVQRHHLGLLLADVDHHRAGEIHRELLAGVGPGGARGLDITDDDRLVGLRCWLRDLRDVSVVWSTDGDSASRKGLSADQSCRLEVVLDSLQPLEVDLGVEEEFRGLGGQLSKY